MVTTHKFHDSRRAACRLVIFFQSGHGCCGLLRAGNLTLYNINYSLADRKMYNFVLHDIRLYSATNPPFTDQRGNEATNQDLL